MKYQMPEPAYSRAAFVGRHTETPVDHYYTAAQVQAAFSAGRAAGLEESRDAVEGLSYDASRGDCADAIRNLSKEPS